LKKTITLIGLNFYPEDTAIGLYSKQLMDYLLKNGYDIQVLTGFPYYPSWKITDSYLNKPKIFREEIDGIDIIRYKQYIPKNPTFFKRILLLIDFTIGIYWNSFKIKKTDLVLTIIPFTSAVFVGNLLAKRKKAKHWVHIQDFEFDAAKETNLAQNKTFLFQFLFWMEKKTLNKADAISTISNAMLEKLKTKVYSTKKTHLLPNWVDVSLINPNKYKKHPYLSSNKFKVLYSGNIGEKQDWELFLNTVKEINDDSIEFIVIGNGAKKKWLLEQISNLENVIYHNFVDYKELPDLLCTADLHILFQKNNVIDTVMPSKILGMMSSGKPSLITGNINSEVASIITKSEAGIYLSNPNPENLIKNIYTIKQENNNYGKNARLYVSNHFSSKKILEQFKIEFDRILLK
jgi:colanic acid biosynthesis glycosyl transferase WcaI